MALVAQEEQPTSRLSAPARQHFQALISRCGVYRSESALISLTGRDRVRWLNGMVSNNIRDLAAGQGVYAFVLNAQGHIQGDLYAFNRSESLILEIERAQVEKLLEIFRRYIIMDKVETQDLSGAISGIGLAGPKSAEVLKALACNPDDLATLQFAETQWNGIQITLVPFDHACVPRYELWIPKEHAESLWAATLKSGAEEISPESRDAFRIACGIPKVGQDIRERDLPQETGQERALSFTKGCYIGQEIVERIRSRGAVHRGLAGFEIFGSHPSVGTKIQAEGKDVGEITSVATIPVPGGEKMIALGYLRKEHAHKELTAGAAQMKPVSLPFLEKMKLN